jgi:tagaturonate reductase
MVPHALLSGLETVKDCMDDDAMCSFIHACLFEEIIPTLDLPKDELVSYANDVLTRFSNPYIKHYLASISLNSISKFKVPVLPSILEYKKRFGTYPKHLIYGFARLLEFYRIGTPNDDPAIIEFMRTHFIDDILANTDFWGQDLSDMKEVLSHAITSSR